MNIAETRNSTSANAQFGAGDNFTDYYWNKQGMSDAKEEKKNSYLLFLFILSFISCSDEYRYMSTEKIKTNLYLEKYFHYELVYYYLTDSSNFRRFVGRDGILEHSYIDYIIKDTDIQFFKYKKPYFGKIRVIIERTKLNLTELQSEKIFDSIE